MTPAPLSLAVCTAVLFDLDGVITPTADVHMRAWRETFEPFLEARRVAPYSDSDYYHHLDGKPRYEGVAELLASRHIELPWGSSDDPPSLHTVCGIGNLKNADFARILEEEGVAAYPGSITLLNALRDRGLPLAIVSSSKNAREVLRAAQLENRFVTVVDGNVATAEGLAGKPQPDTFLRAASILGVSPESAVVVEDALGGVAAAAAGRFGLVIGVNRGAGAGALHAAGARLVVDDLAELVSTLDQPSHSIGED